MRRSVLAILVLSGIVALATGDLTAKADTKTDIKPAAKPDLQAQVFAAETAFARTMADRDHKMFGTFIAEEAIFFGGRGPTRGKTEIVAAWKRFFDAPAPPFSWRPEVVEVLPSGTLAHSSGPVTAADGRPFGVFNSIWRLEADGHWRVVFDKGCDVCDTTRAQ